MNRFGKNACGLVLGLVAAAPPVSAAQLVVEGVPLATRVVMIDPDSLVTPAGRALAERQLRGAAKAVCEEQYLREAVYLYVRACTIGTYDAAVDQLKGLQARGRPEGAGRPQLVRD
jgi:UrcA family protein